MGMHSKEPPWVTGWKKSEDGGMEEGGCIFRTLGFLEGGPM